MPFRFRKSIKLGKGFKLNLSKSGISSSIGGKGFTVNLGKRGARTTVGIPGSGLSYSTPMKITSPKSYGSGESSAKQTGGAGCLAGIFNLFTIPFRIISDLIKSISNPQTRRSSLILVGALLSVCCLCLGGISILNAIGALNTPTPTIDLASIQNTAQAGVFISFTKTALALPTATFTITPTLTITFTPAPTNTFTSTATSTLTETPIPTDTEIVYIAPTLPADCIAAYPDFCISKNGPRIACKDLPKNFKVLPPDPLQYDKDHNGIGCQD